MPLNVFAVAPAVMVIPVEKVTFPTQSRAWLFNDPANPVKFTFRLVPPSVSAYVPPVKLISTAFAWVIAPVKKEIAVDPVLVTFTVFEPDVEKVVPPRLVAKTDPVPVRLRTPDAPKANVLVLVLAELNAAALRVLLFISSVPLVKVMVPVDVKLSARVSVVAAVVLVIGPKENPAEVSVEVAFMVSVPVWLQVIPVTSVMLPETVMLPLPLMVPVYPVQFIDKANAPVTIVAVPVPLFPSKNTASAAVGAATVPPVPPDVPDQLVFVVASQVPVPPTQYLSAI